MVQPIRSLHYLIPVIDEVLHLHLHVGQDYFRYLRFRIDGVQRRKEEKKKRHRHFLKANTTPTHAPLARMMHLSNCYWVIPRKCRSSGRVPAVAMFKGAAEPDDCESTSN